MKILTTFSGKEFILEDEEAENIVKVKNSSSGKAFLELRCGAFVDTSAIESITDIPLIPFLKGNDLRHAHYLSKDSNGNYFYQYEDKRKYVEIDEIDFIENPEYKKIAESKFKQLKNGE